MKKLLLSAITALAFLFGFASCSGDLHDADAIDMTKLYLRGDMNSWGSTPLTDNGDGSWSVSFTATLTPQQFAIATGDNNWTTAYRGVDAEGSGVAEITAADFGKDVDLYHKDGMGNATIATEIGTEYTITITPKEGYLTTVIEKGVTPPDLFVVSGTSLDKMELTGDGIYTAKFTASGTKHTFKVFNGTDTFGTKVDSIELNKESALISTADAKAISVAGLKNDNDYVITVNYSDVDAVTVLVEADAFKAFIIGDISGDFVRMTNLTDTIVSYTFEYATSMTAWGSKEEGKISFIVNDKDGWTGNTKIFRNKTLTLNSEYKDSGEDDKNVEVVGLVAGHTYTILVDVSGDKDLKKAKIIDGKPLFIAGGMNDWSFGMLDNDANGAYFLFAEAADNQEFKVNFVPGWVDGETAFAGVHVADSTKVGSGDVGPGSSNASVTAAAGNKLYISYDYNSKKYFAWVSSK